MADHVAIYPGSFDPPTWGHQDVIHRASRMFDKVYIAVANNTSKSALFTPDEKCEMLLECAHGLKNIEIIKFSGLIVDLAREKKAIALIRGIRAVSDFEYEMTMAATNRKMYPECDTISFMPEEEYMFISSRLVKEIATLGGDITPFVPPHVATALVARVRERASE